MTIYILATPRSATATSVNTEAKLSKVRVNSLSENAFQDFFCDGISPISLYHSLPPMFAVLAYKRNYSANFSKLPPAILIL